MQRRRRQTSKFRAFISFAQQDHHFVHPISARLIEVGIEPIVAIERRSPGVRLDQKVTRLIKEADAFVVLLTKKGSQSRWVQQEIGAARSYSKRIFALKARSVGVPGMLAGTEYLPFSISSRELGIQRLTSALTDYAQERGVRLWPGLPGYASDFQTLHLPESLKCPKCEHIDVHVSVCLICGEWVCFECGATIPPDAKVR